MTLQTRAKTACQIAGIDPDRFNEHVKAGNYQCAPETVAGSARIFNEDQIVALWVFGDLLRYRVNSSYAGDIACRAFIELMAHRDAVDKIRVIQMGDTPFVEAVLKQHDATEQTDNQFANELTFDVNMMRGKIRHTLGWIRDNAVVGD